VTGVEIVIENYLPEVRKIVWFCKLRGKKLHVNACVYLTPLWRYGASKIMGSWPWPFWVAWCHRSRDHLTRGGRLILVVYCDHAFILHRYRYQDIAIWSSSWKALSGREVGCRSLVGPQY